MYVHSQQLSIAITEWVDDSDSQSENKLRGKPNEPKDTKIKPVTLCAHGGYKASFEASFVDLFFNGAVRKRRKASRA